MVVASCGSPVTAIIVVNAMKRPAIPDIINVIDEKKHTRDSRNTSTECHRCRVIHQLLLSVQCASR